MLVYFWKLWIKQLVDSMEIERIKQKIITEECMAAIPKWSIRSKNKKYILNYSHS